MADTTPDTGIDRADDQLERLRQITFEVDDRLPSHPACQDDGQARAARLVACASDVDDMCSQGDLPSAWARPFLVRLAAAEEAASLTEKRLTEDAASFAEKAAQLEPTRAADDRNTVEREPVEPASLAEDAFKVIAAIQGRTGWDTSATPGTVLGPARVELMGHRIRIGIVSEVTMFGQPFLRIDFPDSGAAPEFYRPDSVYGILPRERDSDGPLSHAAAGHYIEDEDDDGPF